MTFYRQWQKFSFFYFKFYDYIVKDVFLHFQPSWSYHTIKGIMFSQTNVSILYVVDMKYCWNKLIIVVVMKFVFTVAKIIRYSKCENNANICEHNLNLMLQNFKLFLRPLFFQENSVNFYFSFISYFDFLWFKKNTSAIERTTWKVKQYSNDAKQ